MGTQAELMNEEDSGRKLKYKFQRLSCNNSLTGFLLPNAGVISYSFFLIPVRVKFQTSIKDTLKGNIR